MLVSYGSLLILPGLLAWLLVIIVFLTLAYFTVRLIWWTVFTAVVLWLFGFSPLTMVLVSIPLLALNVSPLRRIFLSKPIMALIIKLKLLPEVSDTEQIALDAGTTWIDKDLFSGRPKLNAILRDEKYPHLSSKEQAFLDGPVEQLCAMAKDWQIYQAKDFPLQVWDFISWRNI